MKKIAIFASGSGSNAENIIQYFAQKPQFCVKSVFCNVPDAYVLERAKKYRIPTFVFNREEFRNPDKVFRQLQEQEIDFIVLAGFLWLMPSFITAAWPNKIVNIHPALLPAYGGKGMYGMHVHEAVVAACERETGITIHYIDEHYDEGTVMCTRPLLQPAKRKAASPFIMSMIITTRVLSSFRPNARCSRQIPPTTSPPGYMNWNTGISRKS